MNRILGRISAALLSLASIAYSHAIVLSATPAQSQEVSGPDVPISLRFNSRIDLKRSKLVLVMSDGKQTPLDINDAAARDCLISKAKGLKSGSYVLRWQVLAIDGHITRGEAPFRVK